MLKRRIALVANTEGLVWYTDGSTMQSGVKAGVMGPSLKLSIPMGQNARTFQAEVYAIKNKYRNMKKAKILPI